MKSYNYVYTIPKFLYDTRIYSYLENLISNGTRSYSKVDEAEKEDLVCLIIEVLGADAEQLFLGNHYYKLLSRFHKYLKTARSEDAYDLLDQMRENAIDAYDYHLEQLFNEIFDNCEWRRSA